MQNDNLVPKCYTITIQNTLYKLQRLACVSITGAMRTSPTAALEAILDLTPLHTIVERDADKALHRLTSAVTGGAEIP